MDLIQGLFSTHQFGFLTDRSAVQQLLIYIYSLFEAKRLNSEMDVVYMDFRKAFDSISHNKLLIKLQSISIPGRLFSWFQYYLTPRRQYVRVGDSQSHRKT